VNEQAHEVANQLGQVVIDDINKEIERLQRPSIVELEQVKSVHEWLENKRRSRQCGRIVGESRTGKTVACDAYRLRHRPAREIGQAPAIPLLYIQPPQECSPKDLFISIITGLRYQITKGTVSDLRSRTYQLLQICKVEMLLIDEADRIKARTFADVRDLYDRLNLSVVLIGTERLNAVIKKDEQVYNRFRASYQFGTFTPRQLARVVSIWELDVLRLPAPSNLASKTNLTIIGKAAGGYIGLMDTILCEAAIRSLKQGADHVDEETLREVVNEYSK
jgi:DNA transposition AAA+ family ATPase